MTGRDYSCPFHKTETKVEYKTIWLENYSAMNTMKEKLWTVLVTSVLLQCFGEVDAYSAHLDPSPFAKVNEGDNLTLKCSCNGPNTPAFISWYLNNDMFGLVIETRSCQYLVTPEEYDIDRYTLSCNDTNFCLSIAGIAKVKDDQDSWECDPTVIGMDPLQKASTTIVVIDAGKNGQSDKPKTVADTGMDDGVIIAFTVAIAVIAVAAIAVAGYFLCRKRRNDHLKNKVNKDHHEDHHEDHLEDHHEDYDDNHEQMVTWVGNRLKDM